MTRATVLVVDDEPDMLAILGVFLGVDHRVLLAADVPTALELLASERCDVVVTDIRMPGASGLTLIEEARRARPELRFVVVSGGEPDEAAGVPWLAKPFRRADLVAAVEDELAKARPQRG